MPLTEAARIQFRRRRRRSLRRWRPAPVGVESGVKADLEGQVERLAADEARQRRSGIARPVRRRLEVGVVGLLRGQRHAALGAHGRSGHFAVRQFVLGQHRGGREELVANVALDAAARRGCRRRCRKRGSGGASGWIVGRFHVRLQLGVGFGRLSAVGALEAQIQDAGRFGAVRLVHLDDGVRRFAAGSGRSSGQERHVVLVVQMDVPLQEELDGKGLGTEGAPEQSDGRGRGARTNRRRLLDGQDGCGVGGGHVSVKSGLGVEDVGCAASGASEELRLAAVLDGQMDLDGHLRVERLFAEGAAVEVVGVHVQQVLLQLVRRRKRLGARRASEFAPAAHQVAGHVRFQQVRIGDVEFRRAVRATVPARALGRLLDGLLGRPPLWAAEIRRKSLLPGGFVVVGFDDGRVLLRSRAIEPQDVGQAVGGQGVLLEGRQIAEAQAAQLAGVEESGGSGGRDGGGFGRKRT